MFGMFPFLFNGNNTNDESVKDLSFLNNAFNDDFINRIVDEVMSSDFIGELTNDLFTEEYDINFKDFGDYYLIKGYLPGITPKDVSIDFEKNKAILTIKKKSVYSNGRNSVMTVVKSGASLTKNFYIEEVDVTRLGASFENNLLIITMPKLKKSSEITTEDIEAESDDTTIIDVDNYNVE